MRIITVGAAILSAATLLSGCTTRPPALAGTDADAMDKSQQCYQEFAALKNLDAAAYETYKAQLDAINKNHNLYKSNVAAIDGKAAEVMETEIERVLSLVCFRINNAIYVNMLQRAQTLQDQL